MTMTSGAVMPRRFPPLLAWSAAARVAAALALLVPLWLAVAWASGG